MNKTMIALALSLGLMMPANTNAQEMIGKNNIKLESDQMTPEALWAMGRIATAKPSPDGKKIVLQTGYYSVKQNKSHHVLSMMDADLFCRSACFRTALCAAALLSGAVTAVRAFSPAASAAGSHKSRRQKADQ